CEITDYIDYDYFEFPFKILGDIVEVSGVDLKELYDYCCVEIRKDKYNVSNIFTEFNNLFMFLALKVNPNGFIEFQDELLSKIDDMSSYDAARILEQKINLYNYNNQPEKAWEIIEGNIQIESFCKKLAEKKINEKKYAEAKKLINDYLNEKNDRHNSDWNKLLFKIAQQEKDIPMIRELSFGFIERQFEIKYFKVYKSTFTNKEWQTALQQLINHYENSLGGYHVTINMYKAYTFYNKSIFELLVAEGANERLMEFVEKYLSVELIEQYYENFVAKFPQKTLLLFRKALDDYAEKNTGHDAYNYLAQLLKKMQKIEGGKEIVKDMLKQYEILYKNRTSMRNMIKTF
ncbi:MAG: hypothetical protein LBU34_02945, partial [Planctomycetaceae bacterium]|nr:hypothetical protein [Planctomycetaceae bacterium]